VQPAAKSGLVGNLNINRQRHGVAAFNIAKVTIMYINEQERVAIYLFLAEHWDAFAEVASDFLTEGEIEDLGEKLGENK